MSSINSLGNSLYELYLRNTQENSNTQSLTGLSNNNSNSNLSLLDSTNFSQESLNLLNSSTQNSTNPLNSLVSSGTLTQTQADTVNSAFQAALQVNLSGTYGSTPFNPIKSLVNNGTITQAQATAITNAYISVYKSTNSTSISSGNSANITDDPLLDDLSNNGTANEENYMDSASNTLLGDSDSSNNIF